MLADQWYYRLDGRPHGPFAAAELEKLIRGRAITLETEVSSDGRRWRPLGDVLAEITPDPAATGDDDWMNAPTLMPDGSQRRKTDSDPAP